MPVVLIDVPTDLDEDRVNVVVTRSTNVRSGAGFSDEKPPIIAYRAFVTSSKRDALQNSSAMGLSFINYRFVGIDVKDADVVAGDTLVVTESDVAHTDQNTWVIEEVIEVLNVRFYDDNTQIDGRVIQ